MVDYELDMLDDMSKDEIIQILKQTEKVNDILEWIPEEVCSEILLENRDIALKAVQEDINWYRNISSGFQTDKVFVSEILRKSDDELVDVLSDVDKDVRVEVISENRELALRLIKNEALWYVDFKKELQKDQSIIEELLKTLKREYERDNERYNGIARTYYCEYEIIEALEDVFRHMEEEKLSSIFSDRDRTLQIMKINGDFVEYATPEMKADKEVILTAARNEISEPGIAGGCMGEELRNDRDLIEELIDITCYTYLDLKPEMKKDEVIALKTLKRGPELIWEDEILMGLLENEEFLERALTQSERLIKELEGDLREKAEKIIARRELENKEEILSGLEDEQKRISEEERSDTTIEEKPETGEK